MSCTCTEDKEMRTDINGNKALCGVNKVTCQECLDAKAVRDAQKAKDDEIAQCRQFLASTDYKILRQTEQQTMSVTEYDLLLALRQSARDKINELLA